MIDVRRCTLAIRYYEKNYVSIFLSKHLSSLTYNLTLIECRQRLKRDH